MKNNKCPRCGFILKRDYDVQDINKLLSEIEPKKRELMSKAVFGRRKAEKITRELLQDLFSSTEHVELSVVEEVVEDYVSNYISNKPIVYLKAMILGKQKERDELIERERGQYGINPPVRRCKTT